MPAADTRPTLYLIDGYAQFFRAFHAIRAPMTSPVTKEPTNMTYGFVGMLLRLLRGGGKMGGRPTYVAVAIDKGGDKETFRSELYPEYKANRPPPPDGLFPQVDRCLAILERVGVPVVGAAGFEADDVIATIVSRLARERPEVLVRIVSKDKDLKQLLAPGRVELYDVHTDEIIDAAALKAETGLEPAQVIDMLALMGDNVDNVPGVEGVGPKTAAELIAKYGSVDALLAHADEVKGKRGEKLRAAGPLLDLSRRLVTLRHDAPEAFDLTAAETARFALNELPPILRDLGFNRYQDEVRALVAGGGSAPGSAAGTQGAGGAERTEARAAARGASGGAARSAGRTPAPDAIDAGGLFSLAPDEGPAAAPSHDPADPSGARRAGAATRGVYRCCRTPEDLAALLAELRAAPIFALDTETTGLSPLRADLCGLSFCTRAGTGWYVPVRSPEPEAHLDPAAVLAALRPVLADPARPKCGHNLKFDLLVLRRAGVALGGVATTGFDSMVASYLIDASRSSHAMDSLALALLSHTNIPITDLIGSGRKQRTFDTVPLDLATEYAAEDADVSLRLMEAMRPRLAETGLDGLFREVEMPLVEVLADLEWNGVQVDPAELERQRARLSGTLADLRGKIDDAAQAALGRTFNPDSPKQLAGALFGKPSDEPPGLGLRVLKRTATGPSTDVEVLEKLDADPSVTTPIPGLIVEHRQLAKLVGTYLENLKEEINPATGRIHASFNQTVAATGRLSSSDPNLQNIPIRTDIGREIRRAFVAPPGRVLVSADYSQVELRLLAHLSQDPALIEAFSRNEDIHTAVAAQVYGVTLEAVSREQRAGAKMVNFGIVYGVTPFGLARRLGIPKDEAAAIIDQYKRKFAGITTFLQECIEQARTHGYVETMLKRRRPITGIDDNRPSQRALAERMAINSVVQGSAADLIKLAMVSLHRHFADCGGGTCMILQIHDELVFEADEAEAPAARERIVATMESAMELRVPLKADSSIARNWFDES